MRGEGDNPMTYAANTPEEYIAQVPENRKQAMALLRASVKEHLPAGFAETMQYGMIGYVVPHSIYPAGYHVTPKEPLPFMGIASQKNHVALYHMGLYAFPEVLNWFTAEYPKHVSTKLDMGKGCIRFKNVNTIPYGLIAELSGKISLEDYIAGYERSVKK